MATYQGSIEGTLTRLDTSLRRELEIALDMVTETNRKRHVDVVKAWSNAPRFIKKPVSSAGRSSIRRQVLAAGDEKTLRIYTYVNKGTEPHIIRPKEPGGVLVFEIGYSARTAPIANSNVGTGKADGKKVFTRGPVEHPGTEGREFSGYFALESQDLLPVKIIEAIRRVASRR